MKKLIILLLLVTLACSAFAGTANNPKLSPELQGYNSSQQVRVIVQYAPGTQVNCQGLLGLVDCLVGDIVKLGGTILAQLPLDAARVEPEWRMYAPDFEHFPMRIIFPLDRDAVLDGFASRLNDV